ncbi:hypothetical protein HY224_02970 [Candidatus Uhrbacteria bacterium]|nr:hypothetical protein [Candidatus Uhrbacteria bacterium]
MKFSTVSFWLGSAGYLGSPIIRGLWFVFGLFVLLAVVARLVILFKKRTLAPLWSRLLRKLYKMFAYMGVLGLALVFFTYEDVPYLSTRLFYGLWLLGALAWIIYIVVQMKQHMSQDLSLGQVNDTVKQYMPGR